jgi:tetratricopeptide (TPR) repeat protein
MRKMLVLIVVSAPAWAGWVEKYRSGESSLAEGRTAVALEHLQAAAKEAEVARASDAQLAAVYDALGRAGMGSGHYRDGRRNFERALRLAADGPLEARAAVTSNLGQACQALGELVRAEQLFRQALAAMLFSAGTRRPRTRCGSLCRTPQIPPASRRVTTLR